MIRPIIKTENLNFYYGNFQALSGISMEIPENRITAIIGPSGCGKSTFLRVLNRMFEIIPGARAEGKVFFREKDIFSLDPVELRRKIGMVFQKPTPFPKSIFENVAYGLRVNKRPPNLKEKVEWALRQAALWEEVKDKLHRSAFELSGGQQQRLCIARALAVEPEVLLMDEPCSSLDPIATAKIESLINQLKQEYTVIIVTHNMQQAKRISDFTAVFLTNGELIEYDETEKIFNEPKDKRVKDYITGKFG